MATTSKAKFVKQRLPSGVKFEEQSVTEAVNQALTDNDGDKYASLADLWERIDSEMLYTEVELGPFRRSGPKAKEKANYYRGLSDTTGPGKIQQVDLTFSDVRNSDGEAEF